MGKGRMKEVETWHSFMETLTLHPVKKEIVQADLNPETAARSSKLFYYLTQSLAKWERGSELLRSCSRRQGQSACGYEVIRTITSQYSIVSRMEAVFVREQALKLYQHVGHLKRPTDLIRHLEDSFSKTEAKLSNFPELQLSEADRCSVLLQSLGAEVRQYVVLHGSSSNWEAFRRTLTYYEEQLRLCEAPGSSGRALQEKLCDYCGKKGRRDTQPTSVGSAKRKNVNAVVLRRAKGKETKESRKAKATRLPRDLARLPESEAESGGSATVMAMRFSCPGRGSSEPSSAERRVLSQPERPEPSALVVPKPGSGPEGSPGSESRGSESMGSLGSRVLKHGDVAHVCKALETTPGDLWLVDSGATCHIVSDKHLSGFRVVKKYDRTANLFNASGGAIVVSGVVDLEVHFGDVFLRLEEVLVADVGFNVVSPWTGSERGWKTYLAKSGSRLYKGNGKKSIKLMGASRAWWALSGRSKGRGKENSSRRPPKGIEDMEIDALKDRDLLGSSKESTAGPQKPGEGILKKGRKTSEEDESGRHALAATPFGFLLRGLRAEVAPRAPAPREIELCDFLEESSDFRQCTALDVRKQLHAGMSLDFRKQSHVGMALDFRKQSHVGMVLCMFLACFSMVLRWHVFMMDMVVQAQWVFAAVLKRAFTLTVFAERLGIRLFFLLWETIWADQSQNASAGAKCAESRSASDANLRTPIIIAGPVSNTGRGCNGYVPTTKFQIRSMLRAMLMVALQLVGSCLMASEEDRPFSHKRVEKGLRKQLPELRKQRHEPRKQMREPRKQLRESRKQLREPRKQWHVGMLGLILQTLMLPNPFFSLVKRGLPLEIIMDGASGDKFTPSVALSSPGSPGKPPTPPALESPSFELPGVEPPGGGPSSPVAVYPSPVVTEAAESSADGPSQADAAGSPVEENAARSPPKADIAESPLFSESEGEESWGTQWPNPSKRLRAGVPSKVEGPTPPRVGIPANISPGSLSPPFGAVQVDVGTQLLLRALRLEAGRRWEHAETLGLAKVSVDSTEPIPLLSHLAGIPANMNDAYDAPSLAFCAPGHALRALCSPTATMLGPIGLPDLEHPAAWLPATPVIPVTAAYPEEPVRVSRPKMVESEAQCIIGQQEWEVWLGRCLEGKSLAEYGIHMEDVEFAVRVTELLEAPRAARAVWKRRFQEPNPVSMLHYIFHCRAVLQTYLATPAGYRGLVGARASLLVKVPQSVTSLELKTAWAYLDSGIYLRVARYYRRKREEERLHEARESMRAARAKSAAIPQGGVVDTTSSSSDEESLLLGEGEVTALNRAQGQEDLSDIAIWRTLEELTGQRLSQLDGFVGADEGNQPAEAGQPAPPSPASSMPPGELGLSTYASGEDAEYQRHGVNIPPSVPKRSRLPTPPRAMSASATGQTAQERAFVLSPPSLSHSQVTAQVRQALEEGQRFLENGFTPGLDLGIIVLLLTVYRGSCRENQTIGLDFFYFGKLRVLLMMHLGSKYTVSLPAMHLDDPDLLHNINRVIREMGLVGKAVTFRMDQEAALGALAEKLTKCDSSPASATLIDVVPGYRPQSKGSIERQVETMKQGFWSVWLDLEKEVAKVKQETEAVELGKYQLPLGGLLWQACVFYVARCYNLWCTSVGDSSTSIDRLHEEIVNRTRTRPFGCLVQAQVSKSKAHHDKFRGARTVKAVYLGPVHAKGGGIFAVPVGSREIDIFPVARMIQGGDIYDAKTLEELSLAKPLLQDTEDPERPILFDPLEAPGDDAPDEGAGVGMDEDGDEEMIENELADYSPSEAPENQEVVNDEGDMEIDWLTNHYLESLFRGSDLRATSTAVAKSFDLKFGGTKIRCAVPQNAVSETSGEKLEPDLLYASMKLELEELESFKVGEVIPEREARRLAKENGRRVLTSRWVNTVKKKGLYRSRLVVRDYASMGGTTLSEGIYSPTASLEGLRLLLSMLCRRGSVLSCDVSVAFMHAPVARAEFVELPNNVSTQGTGERVFVKLRKAMNGLRSAPLSWYCELAEYLRSQNFEASLDPTIFRRLTRKGLTIVLFYVDDLLIYSEDEAEGRRFYEELRKRYKMKLTGELIQDCPGEVSFLGRRIFRREKGERTVFFGLDEQYLSSCCEEYGITKPAPKLPSLERRYAELLKKGQTELISPAAHERYRRTLGCLAWAALSRPDLQFVCGFLGRHQAAPDEAAETCMRDVLRWVKGLPHKVQRFPSKREILEDDADPASVSCFTDASWSLNSVSGGIITWENCSLKSFSRKQTTTALSSAEAELAALTEVAREGLYIALLVETIREGMPKDRETGYYVLKGYSDSESAVCVSKMQTLLRKVRHIELRAAFLQELVARGRFTIEHIPGVINPADALTKSPTNESLASLYDASGLVDEPKAWESEPTEVHVSFEEPNENERFTPSVPPSWKAAALKLARGEAKYVVVELCCEEGSALSKACSKVPEIAYFGVTKEVDLLSYNGLHLRFKKGGKALEKWRAALAVHKRSWKRIEKLLEPYVGADVASLEACILELSNRTAAEAQGSAKRAGCMLIAFQPTRVVQFVVQRGLDRPPRQSKERKPGKAALALHTVWEKLTPEARLAIEEAGWRPPSAAAVVPPPGLGDFDVDMDASEACEAKQKLWSEATEQQKELMLKAGLKPPEQTPAPTSYEVGTAANAAFRKATVALKLLGDKKISLQKRIDQAKEQYNARLTEMKQLQTKIEEAQQQVADAGEELTTKVLAQDESLNGEIAQFLEKFGISLTEEQEAKIAAVRAGTHGTPDSQAFDLKAAAPNTQEVPKKSEPAQNGQRGTRSRSPRKTQEAAAEKEAYMYQSILVWAFHESESPCIQTGRKLAMNFHFRVAVRPAGCTQADQVLVHSTWSGSALAQSGDPGVSALWASLLQGLEHMCHVQVLQAVEALEAGQYILEDTFPWFAAELAVEAGDDVPWHVAASAIRDVIANLESNADGKKLLLVSSNVTKWRKSLATFLAGIRPDLWLVQETHIKEEQGDLLATHVGAFGYQAFSLPGVGFQSVVLRIRGVDIFLVNVYLKTGEGDFNEDISVLVTTSLAQVALALSLIWSLPVPGTGVEAACPNFAVTNSCATPSAFPELIQVSEQQFRHHSKLWMQKQSASYGKWLKQASCKGLRGLFTSVKADEAVQLRPFLHQPVQERIYLRWRQWFELWSAPGGVDPALLSDLRQRARMQAKELGPIPLDQAVAAFKRVPSKAPGLDGWTFEMLKNLQRPAVASIISFLHHCETEATWPAQMVFALIALLPKSEKRERPIALLHVLYRTWVRMRWKLVSDWQFQYCKAAVWDKAMPGSQVLDVALGRLLRGEAARQSGQHLVTIFIDMETFYDRCRFNDVISSGLSLGYPPLVLHQALLTYMGPRFLQSEGSLCPAITPTKGVLAGCPAAPSISKLVVHPIAVAATSKRATSNLDVWIDDLSLDCVGASAKQIASDAVLLFRSLRTSIEATGARDHRAACVAWAIAAYELAP
ncbi:unnamed protein product, partial [Symbiodinium sp. CCMP2592]